MNVLVAGCGWLGREVAQRLIARGDRVTGLTRTSERASRLRADGIDAVAVDMAEPDAWRSLPHAHDGIVAAQSAAGRDESDYRRAYVEATRGVLASAANGAAFVYVSSTGVFGASDGSWVDETTIPEPTDATSRVLLEAEQLVLDRSQHAAHARVVRCSGLYGPGRTGTIERVRNGQLALGDEDDAWMNFCHRDDAAAMIVAALDRGRTGSIYHASDGNPATRRDVVSWIAERAGITPHRRDDRDRPPGVRRANRRISGEASRRELDIRLAFPSFREGLAPFFR